MFCSAWRRQLSLRRGLLTRTFSSPTIMGTRVTSETTDASSWVHYQHNDGLDHLRWTAKQCHEYLEDRPWADVLKFYSLVAAGNLSLQDLRFPARIQHTASNDVCPKRPSLSTQWLSEDALHCRKEFKGGKWDRKTFKITLAYDGSAFDGWQRQPSLYTVQGLLEQVMGKFCDGKRATSLRSEQSSVEAVVTVAGRTDKGVHAAGQVCSFYTWRSNIEPDEIKSSINALELKSLRVINVVEVSRTFHPNFSACWRRYIYILPLFELVANERQPVKTSFMDSKRPEVFDVLAVNEMLKQLEGKQLSYTIFARDTKIARSRGPPTECIIYHARAAIAELPSLEQGTERRRVMCVEIVGNRFLRKMVRVLVATSIREAAAGAQDDSLVRLTEASCRRASAPPAPPCGLCLTEVGYDEFFGGRLLISRN